MGFLYYLVGNYFCCCQLYQDCKLRFFGITLLSYFVSSIFRFIRDFGIYSGCYRTDFELTKPWVTPSFWQHTFEFIPDFWIYSEVCLPCLSYESLDFIPAAARLQIHKPWVMPTFCRVHVDIMPQLLWSCSNGLALDVLLWIVCSASGWMDLLLWTCCAG